MDIEAYISSGILEAYLLGQTTAEEAAIVVCVAKNNARVREALAELSQTLEGLAELHAVVPPPALKETIRGRLSFGEKVPENQPQQPIRIPLPTAPATDRERTGPWKVIAAAAVLLLAVSTAGFFYSRQQQAQTAATVAQLQQTVAHDKARLDYYAGKEYIIAQPGMELVVLQGVETHPEAKALVMWNRQNDNVFLDVINMPEAPAGKQYQLWAMVGGKPVSAGLYNGPTLQSIATINTAEAFAITLENAGGVESPTLENLMVMGTVKG